MIYQGSKAKYADAIVPILQKIINKNNIQCYIEPFVGGANIIDKINCSIKIGYDKNYSLICLHNQAQKSMSTIPAHGSSEWWYEAKSIYQRYKGSEDMENEMEGWRIGAIQFLGSYNRGGFSRGYAITDKKHDYYNQAWINLAKQSENKNYKNIIFEHKNYEDLGINLRRKLKKLIHIIRDQESVAILERIGLMRNDYLDAEYNSIEERLFSI